MRSFKVLDRPPVAGGMHRPAGLAAPLKGDHLCRPTHDLDGADAVTVASPGIKVGVTDFKLFHIVFPLDFYIKVGYIVSQWGGFRRPHQPTYFCLVLSVPCKILLGFILITI